MRFTWTIAWAGIAVPALSLLPSVGAQQTRVPEQPARPVSGDWPFYRHDLAGTGHSLLRQITVQTQIALPWHGFPADAPAAGAKRKAVAEVALILRPRRSY